MFRLFIHIALILGLNWTKELSAQLVTLPATTSCGCEGSLTYTNATGLATDYTLYGSGNQIIISLTATNFAVANLCPGSYVLEITTNGQTLFEYFDIALVGQVIPEHVELDVCSNNLTFDLFDQLTNAPIGGTWTNPAGMMTMSQQDPSSAEAGVYWYNYPWNGCDLWAAVIVTINQAPNTGNQTTTLICDTWDPFNMLIYMQGAPDPGGQWYNSLGVPMDGFFHPAVMNSQMFTYIIDDVPGCASTYTTMFIQENSTPNPGIATSILVCNNGSPFGMYAQLDGNPTTGGVWTNPNNQVVSNTFTPGVSVAGIYTYSINALTPCQDQEVTLTVSLTNADPSGISTSINICSNNPTFDMLDALNGNPIIGGTWQNQNGDVITGTFTPSNPGPGTYTYYYPNVGCAPQGADLTIAMETIGNAGNDYFGTICESSGTLNLNALRSSNATNNGIWMNSNNSVVNPVITLNEAAEQTYYYFIDGTYCPDDQSAFTIIVDQPPTPPIDQSINLCSSQGVINLLDYYGNNPSIAFETLQGVAVGNLYDPLVDTNTALTVISPSGNICPDATADLTLYVEQPIALEPLQITVCENTILMDFNELVPSFSAIEGQWYTYLDAPIADQTPLSSDLTSYYFIPTSLVACPIDTGFLEINISTYQASLDADDLTLCRLSESFNLMDSVPSGWSMAGLWHFGAVPLTTTVINPAIALSGSYIYIVPGQGSCPEAHYTIPINFVDPPVYSLGDDLILCTDQEQITIGNTNNDYNFNWYPTDYLNDPNSSTPLLSPLLDTTQITVLVYSAQISNGACVISDTVQVTYYPIPSLPIQDLYAICLGESIQIALPALQTYAWSPAGAFANPTSNVQILSPNSSSTLQVEATNVWGCSNSRVVEIDVNPNPEFLVNASPYQACYLVLDTLLAQGAGNYDYTWSDGASLWQGDQIELAYSTPGIYTIGVTATDSVGCSTFISLENSYEVYSRPNAVFSLEKDVISTLDNTCQMINSTIDAEFFEWTTNFGYTSVEYSPQISFPNEQPNRFDICLTATNTDGCADSTCRSLVMTNEHLFWAPNCFTPDGDQINDYFSVHQFGFDESTFEIAIYDRWGIQVFKSLDWQEPWIGDIQHGTHFAPVDTYNWIVKVKDKESAEYQIFKGHVMLIR